MSDQSETLTNRVYLWFGLMAMAAVAPSAGLLLGDQFVAKAGLVGIIAVTIAIVGFAHDAKEVV